MYEYVLYVDVYMSMTNLKITVTKMYVITVNLLGKAKGMKMVAINMEIPSGCYDCPFAKNEKTNDYGSFCECGILEDYETINLLEHSKHPNCPLVEVEERKVGKCTDCEEYNHEKHYCPKFCDVIRNTTKEMQDFYKGEHEKLERIEQIVNSWDGSIVLSANDWKYISEIKKVLEQE